MHFLLRKEQDVCRVTGKLAAQTPDNGKHAALHDFWQRATTAMLR